ncbi:MAG: hypothetical protein V1703_00370 [Candidatus Altiarchaeota archaeon]
MGKKDTVDIDSEDYMSFDRSFPNPVFELDTPTKIKGLKVWGVFDKSHEAEDPITISYWIVTEKGGKYPLYSEGARRAFAAIKFVPKTDGEALEAATLCYAYNSDYVVFSDKPFQAVDAPQDVIDKVEVPHVEKIGGDYKVTFFTYHCNHTARWYNQDVRGVAKHVVEFGVGVYSENREDVWSSISDWNTVRVAVKGPLLMEKNVSDISEDVLKRRYGQFSTAGAFISLFVRNKESGREAYAVVENEDWYLMLTREEGREFKDTGDYTQYMIENHQRCFEVKDSTFNELMKFEAPAKDEYEKDKSEGVQHVKNKYLEKFYWNAPKNTGAYVYFIREEKYAYDESFLRVLLELGLVVRRECESGHRYVEAGEIDGTTH